MKSKLLYLLAILVLCGVVAAEFDPTNPIPLLNSAYCAIIGGTHCTMKGPIVGDATYSLPNGDRLTNGLSLADVNGNAVGTGVVKGDLWTAYLSAASGGQVSVDNSPPSGAASLSDNAGNAFGIAAGKFYFGVASGDSLPIYPNNAAALAGGLEHGDVYRTGGDPDVLCFVH